MRSFAWVALLGLTFDPRRLILGSNGYPRKRRRPHGLAAGHTGPADPEDPGAGTLPWAGRSATDSTSIGRGISSRPRLAVRGSAEAGRQEVDPREVGREREQPQSSFLFNHREGPRTACRKDGRVAAPDAGNGFDSGFRERAAKRGSIGMFRRKRSAEDFAEEIKTHLELEADELESSG